MSRLCVLKPLLWRRSEFDQSVTVNARDVGLIGFFHSARGRPICGYHYALVNKFIGDAILFGRTGLFRGFALHHGEPFLAGHSTRHPTTIPAHQPPRPHRNNACAGTDRPTASSSSLGFISKSRRRTSSVSCLALDVALMSIAPLGSLRPGDVPSLPGVTPDQTPLLRPRAHRR